MTSLSQGLNMNLEIKKIMIYVYFTLTKKIFFKNFMLIYVNNREKFFFKYVNYMLIYVNIEKQIKFNFY